MKAKSAILAFGLLASFGSFAIEAPKAVEVIVLSNSCYDCEYVLPKDTTVVFKPVVGTTNRFHGIIGKHHSQLVIDGKGMVVISGKDTLVKVNSLRIADCQLVLESVGTDQDKFSVIDVKNDFLMECGTINCELPSSCRAESRVIQAGKCIRLQNCKASIKAPSAGSEIFSSDDTIIIGGGEYHLVAGDDCFSAMNNITVNGGDIRAESLADDVFDSNGDIIINGGSILALTTAKGHEGFDVEPMKTESGNRPHRLVINGGTILATGGKKSDWPAQIITGDGVKVYAQTKLDAAMYSERPLPMFGGATAAKLPRFPDDKCSILATFPLENLIK